MEEPETMITLAQFWELVHGQQARWRIALTLQWCANQRLPNGHPDRCLSGPAIHAIEPGDRYFDTGEAVDQTRVTLHLCATCADRQS